MKIVINVIILFLLSINYAFASTPDAYKKLDKLPLSERWFGIYVDKERVGFYRQKISEVADGYSIDTDGSVRMKVMGFSKESSMRETYIVTPSLVMRSFEVDQIVNGTLSHLSGVVTTGSIRLKVSANGKTTTKQLKFKGDVYPAAVLAVYPLMQPVSSTKSYSIQTFDPEELKIKKVKTTIIGMEKISETKDFAIKLRNDLYPFVDNDIWVDQHGNTILESVRDGLVMTKFETPNNIGAFVGGVALSKKDLIDDFTLVKVQPAIVTPEKLTGLSIKIIGWNDALPLMQSDLQSIEKIADGIISVKTGSAMSVNKEPLQKKSENIDAKYLKPTAGIESDAAEIVAKSKELLKDSGSNDSTSIKLLAAWTAEWLKDTADDAGGSALTSFKSRNGNCQAHARLYTSLARAAGIPTRFVSGLVYVANKGFLYHSWAESYVNGNWVAVDPTYNQFPADHTHLKFFEGDLPEDLAPVISIIGKIKIKVLNSEY